LLTTRPRAERTLEVMRVARAIASLLPAILLISMLAAPASASDIGSGPLHLTNVAGTIFFSANDGVHGRELWRSDGTSDGTSLVADIALGAASSLPRDLTAVGGVLFFTANDGVHGSELWKSDGTSDGTRMVRDIKKGSPGSLPRDIVNVRGRAFFSAQDGIDGRELWTSDGTFHGTRLVKDIDPHPGPDASMVDDLTNFNGTLFFVASDPVHGIEVWKSDGSTAGTTMLADLNDQEEFGWQGAGSLAPVGNLLFFAEQTDGDQGFNLYVTDGTAAGTVGGSPDSALDLVPFRGECYFIAGTNPGWLGRSDGTYAGTNGNLFLPSEGGGKKSWIHSLTPVDDLLFFVAGDGIGGATGVELWASDGTAAGSDLVKDINPSGQSYLRFLTDLNGELMFEATTRQAGAELWRSDGTENGTVLVSDIAPGQASSAPAEIVARGNVVFFIANDGVHGSELWKSDGTPSGTVMVADLS